MTGMILDGVLMLLLVAALGYGVRLEKKLSALRAGQQAFASAVTELNAAAGRAEAALAEQHLRLQGVVAGDGRTGAETAGDIAALPRRTNLLGVAADATEGDVDGTTLDGQAGLTGGEQRAAFFARGTTETAELRLAAEDERAEGQRDGEEDAGQESVEVLHGGGPISRDGSQEPEL